MKRAVDLVCSAGPVVLAALVILAAIAMTPPRDAATSAVFAAMAGR
jgi:hypothetical protein